jgi:hypothetical protein
MKLFLLLACLTTLLFASARAADEAPAVELKQKSSFEGAPNDRDPFWPIGWKKPGPKAATAGPGPDLTPSSFSLTSVTMGDGQRFAILNGKVMQEGQVFGLQFGNQVYNVNLKSIEDGQVVLLYQETEIVVPLRRK